MGSAQWLPEMFYTGISVVYYIAEALIIKLIPKHFRTHKSLEGEIILITGAGHGIGKALAARFARLKCTLVLIDKNVDWLEECRRQVAEDGGTAFAFCCDVSDKESVYSCAARIQREVGHISVLVNNAGVVEAKYLLDLSDDAVVRVFKTNAMAHFWTLKAFLPYMIEQNHGHIVTVASLAGKTAGAQAASYVASKFAAVGLHESLACELRVLRRPGIHCTLICPGLVNTGLFEGAKYRFPYLFPVLDTEKLADRIVEAVQLNEHLVIEPFLADVGVRIQGFLPSKVYTVLADFLGVGTMLDNFRGHSDTKLPRSEFY